MNCLHGVPGGFCVICNHVPLLEVPPFHGTRPDETPHRVKGVWKGIGEHLPAAPVNGLRLSTALLESSPYVRRPFSTWGVSNMLRSIDEMVAHVNVNALKGVANVDILAPGLKDLPVEPTTYQLRSISRWIRPESSVEVTRKAPAQRWHIQPKQFIAYAKPLKHNERKR